MERLGSFTCSFAHSLVVQISFERGLLCSEHCSQKCEYDGEQSRQGSHVPVIGGKTENEISGIILDCDNRLGDTMGVTVGEGSLQSVSIWGTLARSCF